MNSPDFINCRCGGKSCSYTYTMCSTDTFSSVHRRPAEKRTRLLFTKTRCRMPHTIFQLNSHVYTQRRIHGYRDTRMRRYTDTQIRVLAIRIHAVLRVLWCSRAFNRCVVTSTRRVRTAGRAPTARNHFKLIINGASSSDIKPVEQISSILLLCLPLYLRLCLCLGLCAVCIAIDLFFLAWVFQFAATRASAPSSWHVMSCRWCHSCGSLCGTNQLKYVPGIRIDRGKTWFRFRFLTWQYFNQIFLWACEAVQMDIYAYHAYEEFTLDWKSRGCQHANSIDSWPRRGTWKICTCWGGRMGPHMYKFRYI